MRVPSLKTGPLFPKLLASAGCLLMVAGLTGCGAIHRAQLRETEVYYRAQSLQAFPPKPPEAPMPILEQIPPRSRVIGVFRYTTGRGSAFALEGAQHNARKAGADAVVVRNLTDWGQPYSSLVPARGEWVTEHRPVHDYVWVHAPGTPGHWEPRVRLVPRQRYQFEPEHMVSGVNRYTTIEALAIKTQ